MYQDSDQEKICTKLRTNFGRDSAFAGQSESERQRILGPRRQAGGKSFHEDAAEFEQTPSKSEPSTDAAAAAAAAAAARRTEELEHHTENHDADECHRT